MYAVCVHEWECIFDAKKYQVFLTVISQNSFVNINLRRSFGYSVVCLCALDSDLFLVNVCSASPCADLDCEKST